MRTAIYGGSFNPPHLGHLEAARTVYESLKPDSFLIIPDREPPHKGMYTKAAEEQLTSALGRAVRFTGGVNKGKITLEFYSADDREALMAALMQLKKK